ncbi:MAG: hypothetical protein GX556_12060, partial [Fibrobacter sp.]|nr:hypothetical protein [Fibrobacter sp.]
SAVTPQTEVLIKPEAPIFISGTEATVDFKVYSIAGEMTNPQIKYMKWVNLEFQDKFAKEGDPIAAADIINIAPQPVKMGSNSFSFNVPASAAGGTYAFVELIIEGTSADGKKVTSSVGFLPYREIDYRFEVEIYDATGATKLTEVTAGVPVQLKVTPRKKDGSAILANIKPVVVSLSSKYNVYSAPNDTVFFPNGITGESKSNVIFTRVPEGGQERVKVSGIYINYVLIGYSDPITILPLSPAKVTFQDPPSNSIGYLKLGRLAPVTVQVLDKYGNKVNKTAKVCLTSSDSSKVKVLPPDTVTSDSTGLAVFQVSTGSKGAHKDTVQLTALLVKNNFTDSASMTVRLVKDSLVIFYGDTLKYNPEMEIKACSGTRVPVTIRAVDKNGIITTCSTAFSINLSPGLDAYASEKAKDTVKIKKSSLIKGEVRLWLKSSISSLANGSITVTPIGDKTILPAFREKINFEICLDTKTLSAKVNAEMYSYELFDIRGRLIGRFGNSRTFQNRLDLKNGRIARGLFILKVIDNKTGKVRFYRAMQIRDLKSIDWKH